MRFLFLVLLCVSAGIQNFAHADGAIALMRQALATEQGGSMVKSALQNTATRDIVAKILGESYSELTARTPEDVLSALRSKLNDPSPSIAVKAQQLLGQVPELSVNRAQTSAMAQVPLADEAVYKEFLSRLAAEFSVEDLKTAQMKKRIQALAKNDAEFRGVLGELKALLVKKRNAADPLEDYLTDEDFYNEADPDLRPLIKRLVALTELNSGWATYRSFVDAYASRMKQETPAGAAALLTQGRTLYKHAKFLDNSISMTIYLMLGDGEL